MIYVSKIRRYGSAQLTA